MKKQFNHKYMGQAFIVFVSLIVVDFFWAIYIKAMADNKVWLASVYSMFIMLTGGIAVIGYTENHWLLIPAALGCFVGTAMSKFITLEKIKRWWSEHRAIMILIFTSCIIIVWSLICNV